MKSELLLLLFNLSINQIFLFLNVFNLLKCCVYSYCVSKLLLSIIRNATLSRTTSQVIASKQVTIVTIVTTLNCECRQQIKRVQIKTWIFEIYYTLLFASCLLSLFTDRKVFVFEIKVCPFCLFQIQKLFCR